MDKVTKEQYERIKKALEQAEAVQKKKAIDAAGAALKKQDMGGLLSPPYEWKYNPASIRSGSVGGGGPSHVVFPKYRDKQNPFGTSPKLLKEYLINQKNSLLKELERVEEKIASVEPQLAEEREPKASLPDISKSEADDIEDFGVF